MAANIKMTDIDNAKLEEVMQVYGKEPDKDKLMQLVMVLKDTKLFVPAMSNPKKGGFQPYVIKNQAGDLYMPAYTSIKKFPQNDKYQGMLKLPYRQCASMLLDHPTLVQGIALNPYADNLILKTQMLELTREVDAKIRENPPKAYQVKTDDFRMVMRHNAEFHLIPQKLYEEKMDFIQNLSAETLCGLYKVPYEQVGQEKVFPFTKDQFEIMELNVREDLHLIQVMLPAEFLYRTNCRELYILWNPQTGRIGCYIVEKSAEPQEKLFHLISVKEDNTWEKLEDAPSEGNVMNRVMELFEAAQQQA